MDAVFSEELVLVRLNYCLAMQAPQAWSAAESSSQGPVGRYCEYVRGGRGKRASPRHAGRELETGHRHTGWLRLAETSGNHLVQHPCANQGRLEQVAQSHGQAGFECPKGWRLYNSYGQSVTRFDDSHSKKGVFCSVQVQFSVHFNEVGASLD